MRIVITGVPGAGKSTLGETLATVLGFPLLETDVTKHLEWSEASEEVSYWFDEPGGWIIEGVIVPRAIRKWKTRHAEEAAPFDRFVLMRTPRQLETIQGRITMGKQVIQLAETYRDWIGERWVEL